VSADRAAAGDGPEPAAGPAGDARRFARDAHRLLEDARRLVDDAGHAPECRSCPVCRGIVALRQHAPDVLDQVSRLAAALAESLRDHDGENPGTPGAPGAPHPARAPDAEPPWWGRPPGRGDLPRTERIDITD
jgi:hypothetical protein